MTHCASYLQTSALLAGDANLTEEERKHFYQVILTFASQPPAPSGEHTHTTYTRDMAGTVSCLSSLMQEELLRDFPTKLVKHVNSG